MFSTQLKILTYPAILSHRHSTTVSLENYPLYSVDFVVLSFRSDRVLERIFLYECDLVYLHILWEMMVILSSTQVIIMPVLSCNSSRSTEKFALSRLPKKEIVSQPFVSYFVFEP